MTDEELMHYAAIAYGAKKDEIMSGTYYDPDVLDERFWVPLGNDAHAFRIMHKLEIDVNWYSDHVVVFHKVKNITCMEKKGKNSKECLRRAIVCVAAEIGKMNDEQKEYIY